MGKSKEKEEVREPRDNKILPEAYLKPFDVTKFGGEEDPCFGKLYDLNAPECNICGDIEACAIGMMTTQTRLRTQLESENRYKDLEEKDMIVKAKIKKYIQEKRALGWGDTKIIAKLKSDFKLTKQAAKNLL